MTRGSRAIGRAAQGRSPRRPCPRGRRGRARPSRPRRAARLSCSACAAAARGGQAVVTAVAAGEQVLDIEAGSRWRRTRPARASSACQPRPAAMGGDQAAVWTKRAEQASSVRGTSLQRKPSIGVGRRWRSRKRRRKAEEKEAEGGVPAELRRDGGGAAQVKRRRRDGGLCSGGCFAKGAAG